MYRVRDCNFVDRDRLARLYAVHIDRNNHLRSWGVVGLLCWTLPGIIREQKQQTSANLSASGLKMYPAVAGGFGEHLYNPWTGMLRFCGNPRRRPN